MIIRSFQNSDQQDLERIHRSYAFEFNLEDLSGEKFVVQNSEDQIVVIGTNKSLAEVRIVTDKSLSAKDRREALVKTLEVSSFIARNSGYDQLHAFVQDPVWLKQLVKHGFRPTKGISVVIDI